MITENSLMYLLHGRPYEDGQTWRQVANSRLQQAAVGDAVLLESVEEWRGCILHLRLLHHHHALEVGMDTARF